MAKAAASSGPSMKLQIVIDKRKNRVVFAEANNDFVDFIFHILSLPLGAVQKILSKNTSTILGSILTLQEGLNNLDAKYMEGPAKDYLIDLKAPYWGKNTTLLLPEASCSNPRQFYQCSRDNIVRVDDWCVHNPDSCLKLINLGGSNLMDIAVVRGNEKGYVNEVVTFMVMDDLVVRKAVPTSFISLMNQHSIKDVGDIEKRNVTFGTAQAVQLLKSSISSKTVLTDVFLPGAVKSEN